MPEDRFHACASVVYIRLLVDGAKMKEGSPALECGYCQNCFVPGLRQDALNLLTTLDLENGRKTAEATLRLWHHDFRTAKFSRQARQLLRDSGMPVPSEWPGSVKWQRF